MAIRNSDAASGLRAALVPLLGRLPLRLRLLLPASVVAAVSSPAHKSAEPHAGPADRARIVWNDRSFVMLLAFGLLTSVNWSSGGFYHPTAVMWLLPAVPLALLPWRSHPGNTRLLVILLVLLLFYDYYGRGSGRFWLAFFRSGLASFDLLWAFILSDVTLANVLRAAFLAAFLVALWRYPRAALLVGFGALLVLSYRRAAIAIGGTPDPPIDVWDMLQGASAELLLGRNPYAAVYATPDHPGAPVYPGPTFPHYVYLPVTLIPTMAGLLVGDVRWGFVGVSLLAAGLLAATVAVHGAPERRTTAWLALLVAAVMLRAPELPEVWRWSWSDPHLVFLLALFLWSWRRGRIVLAGVALGALFASKQHAVVFAPFALLLTRDRRFWAAAVATCAVTILPFVLADARAFWEDVVAFHLHSEFRQDALNLGAWLWHEQGRRLPGWAPLLPALLVLGLAACRRPFGLAEFFQYSAACYFLVLLFAKHAFMNYYYLVAALWLMTAVASWSEAGHEKNPVEKPGLKPAFHPDARESAG